MEVLKKSLWLFSFIPGISLAQSEVQYFQGKVIYQYNWTDSSDVIEQEEIAFQYGKMLSRITHGTIKKVIGNTDIYLDSNNDTRFEINHDQKVIIPIQFEEVHQPPEILSKDTIGNARVLGFECSIIMITSRSSGHPYIDALQMDTSTFWISNDLRIEGIRGLARLQQFRNTKLFDGTLEGVPLKIMIRESFVIEAVKVVVFSDNDSTIIKLPNYKVQLE